MGKTHQQATNTTVEELTEGHCSVAVPVPDPKSAPGMFGTHYANLSKGQIKFSAR
jgi:hypothetical protein